MDFAHELCDFITKGQTPYITTENVRSRLNNAGFIELQEGNFPENMPNKGFVVRDGRNVFAYNVGGFESSLIVGAHIDSPGFKLKPHFEKNDSGFMQVNALTYPSPLMFPWFNRSLRLAGSVLIQGDDGKVQRKIIDSERGIAFIPLPDSSSKTFKIDTEADMKLIYSLPDGKTLAQYIADLAGTTIDKILDIDINFGDATPGKIYSDFVISPRIDDMHCAFSAVDAFVSTNPTNSLNVLVLFDNEEIGSKTFHGACGTLLSQNLQDLCDRFHVDLPKLITKSLVLSCDSSHADNPNFSKVVPKTSDKYAGTGVHVSLDPYRQALATDTIGYQILAEGARRCGVTLNKCYRDSKPTGSTIGPHISRDYGIRTIDVGCAHYSMHSIREIIAWRDVEDLDRLLKTMLIEYNDIQNLFV